MKKILGLAVAILVGGVVFGWAAGNNSFGPFGSYYDSDAPTESVVAVSSSAVTTSAAVSDGVYREFMNTGTTDIMRFTVLTSSNTAGLSYIAPGAIWIDDRYFGTYYFKVVAGSADSNLSIRAITNK